MSSTLTEAKPTPIRSKVSKTRAAKLNWFQRHTRNRLFSWLKDLKYGLIEFEESTIGNRKFGRESEDELQATWRVVNSAFYSRLATHGSLGVAESYLKREWETEDLTALLRVLCRNIDNTQSANGGLASIALFARRLLNALKPNSLSGSRRHIAAHYDLNNEFFEQFLDPSLMYSCAYFEHPQMSLHDASLAKLEKVCCKLELSPRDRVLEIGTGWGGFALHAATQYGSHITTTTISQAQYTKASERFRNAKVNKRVELLDRDYRQLTGQYDKLVSIEMIEAVGERHLNQFFQQCSALLKPGGKLLIQAILMPEQRYDSYRRGVDFIRQYIFPGGFLPSLAAIQHSVGQTTNLRLLTIEDISPHYAETLRAWNQQFLMNLDAIQELGFDDRFIRMWEYYLCYCEAAFREQTVRVAQIVWEKPMC